jgi:hypothetical protein
MFLVTKVWYGFLARLIRAFDCLEKRRWSGSPLSCGKVFEKDKYLELAAGASMDIYPEIDQYEIRCCAAIDRAWLRELALHTQVIFKKSEVCFAHGRVLYSSLSKWLKDNAKIGQGDRVTVYETGTARGFSALCMAKALFDAGRAGVILTFDVLPHTVPIFWNCIDDLGGIRTRGELLRHWAYLCANYIVFIQGDTRLTLPSTNCSRINFAFLDGSHTYKNVMFEFSQISRNQESGDMIVFDDCNDQLFPGVVRAVSEICNEHGYRRLDLNASASRDYVVATKL